VRDGLPSRLRWANLQTRYPPRSCDLGRGLVREAPSSPLSKKS